MYLVDLFLRCLYFTAIMAAVMMTISYVAAKSNRWAAAAVMIGLVVIYAYAIGAIILMILYVVDYGLLGGVVAAVSLVLQFGVLWKVLARKGK